MDVEIKETIYFVNVYTKNEKENCNKVENARQQNEKVKYRMNVRRIFLFSDSVKNCADGVKNASDENQKHSDPANGPNGILDANQNAPPHSQIRDH